MRRRTRVIAGIFALVAMTFSLAETVIASTCAPGMAMEMVEAAETQDHERDHGHDTEDDRHCPFSPTAAQGCAAAASLPAHATRDLSPSFRGEGAVFVEPSGHDLLMANALFHPPRA